MKNEWNAKSSNAAGRTGAAEMASSLPFHRNRSGLNFYQIFLDRRHIWYPSSLRKWFLKRPRRCSLVDIGLVWSFWRFFLLFKWHRPFDRVPPSIFLLFLPVFLWALSCFDFYTCFPVMIPSRWLHWDWTKIRRFLMCVTRMNSWVTCFIVQFFCRRFSQSDASINDWKSIALPCYRVWSGFTYFSTEFTGFYLVLPSFPLRCLCWRV